MNDHPALNPDDATPVMPRVYPFADYTQNTSAEDAEHLRASHLNRASSLADRARARREKALTTRDEGIAARLQDLTSRDLCIVQTTTDGRSVTNHIFPEVPRLGTLIARTGPDVFLLSVRVQTPDK